jgi:glycosyltransferase involved in cell wall biosynthesis
MSIDRPMRVTFVVPGLDTSGGARIIAGHAQQLAQRGHEVLIVAPRWPPLGLRRRVKALIGRDRLPPAREHSHYARSMVAIHQTGRVGRVEASDVPDADVIIATFWTTAEWISLMPPEKGAKVHFIQGYDAAAGRPNDRIEAVWRLPFHKIAVAQWLVDLGRDRFGAERIALVPNSLDHDHFNPRKRQSRSRPATVGFMFHGADFKDMPTTLSAIQELRRRKPGTNILTFSTARPRRGQLPEGSRFYHLPSQEKIAEIYGRCDAWLSTSRMEGFNLPPLEAMATGCPAVCSKTGRPLEIIENGINGYLVDQGDAEAFADALASIISLDDESWQRMSEAAVKAVAHPTWAESSALFEKALVDSLRS